MRGVTLFWVAVVAVFFVQGCALLPTGKKRKTHRTYLIAPDTTVAAASGDLSCGQIQVASGAAATGFRNARMAYMRSAYELNYFAYARWGDAPSRMLGDQLRRFLRDGGAFDGVLAAPVAARTDYQLELADVKLVQMFSDEVSVLDLSYEIRLFDSDRRTLLATRRFATEEPSGGDAQSGVQAANNAAARLLSDTVAFVHEQCAQHVR